MKPCVNYRIVADYRKVVGPNGEYSWRISGVNPLSPTKDSIRIKGLGFWTHDKSTGECYRIATTAYRKEQILAKMQEMDTAVSRVDELRFHA